MCDALLRRYEGDAPALMETKSCYSKFKIQNSLKGISRKERKVRKEYFSIHNSKFRINNLTEDHLIRVHLSDTWLIILSVSEGSA